MLFWTILKVALKSLIANKLRTLLSMLGIIIGVGAVISMLAIGAGAQQQVMQRISAMGTNLLVIRPGQTGFGGVASGTQQNLKLDDAEKLLQNVSEVEELAPVVGGNVQVKYMDKNSRTSLVGTAVTYFPIRDFEVDKGRMYTEEEVNRMARVVVLGPATVETLFGTEDPLDKMVKINGINFKVVGVQKSKGDQGYFNPDDQVVMPYTTAMKQLLGVDYLREIDVEVAQGADITTAQNNIVAEIRKIHHLQPQTPDDVNIRNQAEFLQTASSVSQTFTILLGGIASISLLVGGIGIMNIMLVTVTERTREIGIRKAVGARDQDILRQFLFEAFLLSFIGGLIGVFLGVGASHLISATTQFKSIVQLPSIVISLSFALAIGIFFGYYPAHRAAKLDPIEALRYE